MPFHCFWKGEPPKMSLYCFESGAQSGKGSKVFNKWIFKVYSVWHWDYIIIPPFQKQDTVPWRRTANLCISPPWWRTAILCISPPWRRTNDVCTIEETHCYTQILACNHLNLLISYASLCPAHFLFPKAFKHLNLLITYASLCPAHFWCP